VRDSPVHPQLGGVQVHVPAAQLGDLPEAQRAPAAISTAAWYCSGISVAITSSSGNVAGLTLRWRFVEPAPLAWHGFVAITSSATAVLRMERSRP
jgi:hypothetical protein